MIEVCLAVLYMIHETKQTTEHCIVLEGNVLLLIIEVLYYYAIQEVENLVNKLQLKNSLRHCLFLKRDFSWTNFSSKFASSLFIFKKGFRRSKILDVVKQDCDLDQALYSREMNI